MADAGYKVVVTYSPSNTKYKSWLDQMKAQGYAFEVVGGQVLVYRKRLGPAEVVSLLGTAKAFVDHVPEVVYSLYPGSA